MIIGLAEIFGTTLTESRLNAYAELLCEFPNSEVEKGIKSLLCNPEIKFFPLPSVIRDAVERKTGIVDATQELLSRAITAVGKFGWSDPEGAKVFVGPIVWGALPGVTGWEEFCRAGDEGAMPIMAARAQLRDRIAGRLRIEAPTGRITLAPPGNPGPREVIYLPGPAATDALKMPGRIVNLLDFAKPRKEAP